METFYSVDEVADMLKVRRETILYKIYDKDLRASKLPKSRIWRIAESDLKEYLRAGENTPKVINVNDGFNFDDIPAINKDK